MRELNLDELRHVSGGCDDPILEDGQEPVSCDPTKRRKGNNGFGNGGDDGVPGRSDFEDVNR